MIEFFNKYKGYIIHALAVSLCFLDPSVQVFLAHHLGYAAIGGALWGFLLHWANGK